MIATISANSIDFNKLAFDVLDRFISFMKFSCALLVFSAGNGFYMCISIAEYITYSRKIFYNRWKSLIKSVGLKSISMAISFPIVLS